MGTTTTAPWDWTASEVAKLAADQAAGQLDDFDDEVDEWGEPR